MADRYCQQFKASETADCLVAGHVLGLCWLYNRLPELQPSMSVHSWHRAFESRGRASARGNSQEAGQFAGHRGEERRFSSDEPSRGKKLKKDESKRGGQNLIKREDGRLYCIFLANSCFCGNSMFKAANTVTRDNLPSLELQQKKHF